MVALAFFQASDVLILVFMMISHSNTTYNHDIFWENIILETLWLLCGSMEQENGTHSVQLVLVPCPYLRTLQNRRNILSSDSSTQRKCTNCEDGFNSFAELDAKCSKRFQDSWRSSASKSWRRRQVPPVFSLIYLNYIHLAQLNKRVVLFLQEWPWTICTRYAESVFWWAAKSL